ncbi:flotillin domain-containing protein [Shimia thalassica]|uniref:Inner membrane protein YqiK n=1 Tax=Shimia thalassica TaxID=1715693 RepID=A0A0P1IB91_9RHOB|nr:flotillin domain-containing protein [Shimia thalassica]MDP2495281.1 flotillin domain-containing protein [Shimia thalassica]MDP2580438.1 flotillin domain-containing protein [Shimia thalassica]CUK02719.1 Inner membrane protein YqiK [Shimia thalassica]
MELTLILVIAATIVGLLIFIGLIMSRLYKRATRETSLVKTGSGGKKVIMDGGTIVVPFLHEISKVNMKTLRLEVSRVNDQSLITKDRMRVDVGVEFYVSVNATEDGISRAAQTLGDRTFHVEQLREMIEGKLIDGLRAVAAQMTMDDLHENRASFVQEVQNAISEDLLKNGLELEAVSLTALDQTPFEQLDENNAFNAVGMQKLAAVIATSRKQRAEITAEADVSVARSEMEAEKLKYQIDREQKEASITQVREIQTLQATQEAEIARNQEASDQAKEQARIERERAVRASEIERERAIREAEIAKERELEVADQDRQIIVARKSEEESQARASADKARAEAKKASEAIETARAVAEAERQKQIALIEAQKEAERMATGVRLAAEAEKDAASDRAAAKLEEAQADANAIMVRAEAKKTDLLATAEGQTAIANSENELSAEIIAMKVRLASLEAMPAIIAEMVKPAEKIDSIKIHQVTGMGGGSSAGPASEGNGTPVNQALDSVLGMALQMPAMQALGKELGISLENGMAGVAHGALDVTDAVNENATNDDATPVGAAS